MSVKSSSSGGGGPPPPRGGSLKGEVVRSGLLKKLKTCKKKFFVLRAETPESSARLEYYDSEKKFNNGQAPKRSIPLKTCFNINKRSDTKFKHVIALYTKDDCFCIVLDNEEDLNSWLKTLLSHQHGEEAADGEMPRPTFEHIWQVNVLNRGLGTAGIIGGYRLCLTDKTLSLIRNDSHIDLNLTNIRSCGSLKNYFYLEIGRSSTLGAGELWMDTEDTNIAQNIHSTVFHVFFSSAMSDTTPKDDLGPKGRNRSSSATESSKPNNTAYRKLKSHVTTQGMTGGIGGRERCDSMPSRARTTSEGNHILPAFAMRPYLVPSMRPFSFRDVIHSYSPPSGSPVSPPSVGCSTDSTGSSYSLIDETDACSEMDNTMRFPLTPDEAIAEEDCPDSPCGMHYDSYLPMAPQSSDDGYVDMSPRGRHNNNSPSVSLDSITSGTPSTDIRFSDYPLDKVTSYLASDDDDLRKIRAYSVGSRPETYRNMRHVDQAAGHAERVRAFSVGSKNKKIMNRVLLPPHPQPGVKSSSAPLLSNSRMHSSHGSIGPMDDLMEMDFSRSSSSNNSGYVDMKPGSPTSSGYISMRPSGGITEPSPYVDMNSGSSPTKAALPEEDLNTFVDLHQYRLSRHITNPNWRPDYVDMGANNHKNHRGRPKYSAVPTTTAADTRPRILDPKTSTTQTTPDGYVEMTLGKKHQRQSSLDTAQITPNEDYTNMSGGTAKKSGKDKTRSLPIAIQNQQNVAWKNPTSPMGASGFLGRKYSSGTPPHMHLPLCSCSPVYSSLPRQRSRKNSRRDSKDSSSSSVTTTPSSSSTIFPISINSPSSPIKPCGTPQTKPTEHPITLKIPPAVLNTVYKASSGSSKPRANFEDYTEMDFEHNRPQPQPQPKPVDTSEYVNFNPGVTMKTPLFATAAKTDDGMGDYAVMKPGVVTTSGSTSPLITHLSSIGLNESQTQSMCFRPIKEKDESQVKTADEAQKPSEDQRNSDCVSPAAKISRPNSTSSSRPNSASSELCSSTSTLVGSRPESVNSERMRPASVTSDVQLHYASLDLATEDGSHSPRTKKSTTPSDNNRSGSSSSQSTQCEPLPAFMYAEIDMKCLRAKD